MLPRVPIPHVLHCHYHHHHLTLGPRTIIEYTPVQLPLTRTPPNHHGSHVPANTGGGGGSGNPPGSGGSGVVILRYPAIYASAAQFSGATFVVANSYKIYTFTQSGSITF